MIWQRLRELRLARKLTQQAMADALNISRSAYALYEAGRRQLGYETLLALADFFDVSLDYLFGRTDSPARPSEISPGERALLAQLRRLDRRGRRTVQAVVDWEAQAGEISDEN